MIMAETLTRIVTAMILGTIIGAERQWRHKIAGLRTNALVAVGASLFVVFSSLYPDDDTPTRVAAQVVSGIGFLGAGVIIREGLNVKGLNTAATLWCSAAVGILAGGGFHIEAAIGTVVTLMANILIRSLQQIISRKQLNDDELGFRYVVNLICKEEDEGHIRSLLLHELNNGPVALTSLSSQDIENSDRVEVNAEILAPSRSRNFLEQIVSRMSLEKTVSAISWRVLEAEAIVPIIYDDIFKKNAL